MWEEFGGRCPRYSCGMSHAAGTEVRCGLSWPHEYDETHIPVQRPPGPDLGSCVRRVGRCLRRGRHGVLVAHAAQQCHRLCVRHLRFHRRSEPRSLGSVHGGGACGCHRRRGRVVPLAGFRAAGPVDDPCSGGAVRALVAGQRGGRGGSGVRCARGWLGIARSGLCGTLPCLGRMAGRVGSQPGAHARGGDRLLCGELRGGVPVLPAGAPFARPPYRCAGHLGAVLVCVLAQGGPLRRRSDAPWSGTHRPT